MTDDQRKKYEEAAKGYVEGKFRYIRAEVEVSDVQAGFLAGCTFVSQDTEERVKQAHNDAIDKAKSCVYHKGLPGCAITLMEELEKLKL